MSLQEVCARLDATLVEFFTTLDKIYATKNELENVMKDGFFHMAKARYSMGAQSVGALQYNMDDLQQARVHVRREDSKDGETTFHSMTDSTPTNSSTSESSVRKRTLPTSNSDGFVDLADSIQDIQLDTFQSSANRASSTAPKDPIRWFGILVPQALRHAQTRFKRAVALTLELATLEARFRHLRARYRRLLEEKRSRTEADGAEGTEGGEEREGTEGTEGSESPDIEEYDFVEKEKEVVEEVK